MLLSMTACGKDAQILQNGIIPLPKSHAYWRLHVPSSISDKNNTLIQDEALSSGASRFGMSHLWPD